MQIKRLELSGFKSFMNPVALDFGGGITAILGPNGCGKSNVVDSLRWVLGEQSAKQLRGEKMQNVVFGGTKLRKPLGMAEVSVSFVNNQGRIAVPYEEVKLTRRLTRDGQSDYLLNGQPCRLKDIKDLTADTGAGSHGYAIIERDQVDLVVNDHEDSRRFLFEEASGISKYRMRRKEALRKLELTEQDLLRLNDIIEEIARQVRSLRRQMGRARRYQELQDRLRRAETFLAQRRLASYREEADSLRAQLDGMVVDGAGDDAAGGVIEARIEALRAELVGTERTYRDAGARCDSVASELKTAEESILVLRERSESARETRTAAAAEVQVTEQRLEQVEQDGQRLVAERSELEQRLAAERESFEDRRLELASCEERHEAARSELLEVKQRSVDFHADSTARKSELVMAQVRVESQEERAGELRQELEAEARRITGLTAEHAEVGDRLGESASACEALRAELDATEGRIEATSDRLDVRREERADLASRLEATRSRHELLRAMIDAYEGYGEGARSLLQRHGGTRLRGALADCVEPPAGLEAAFEALLHDVLDALLASDAEGAVQLLRELRSEKLGRATLLVPSDEGAVRDGDLAALRQREGVIGLAAELLPEHGAAAPALRRLLARALVVEDAGTAQRILAERRDPTLRVATRDGMLLTGAGTFSGGSERDRDVRLLGRRQRLQELEDEMRLVEQELTQVAASLVELESELVNCREQRVALESQIRSEEAARTELSVARAAIETSLAEASARRAQVGAALQQLETEIAARAALLPELASSAERLGEEEIVHARVLLERERTLAELDAERERLRNEVGELRVGFVTLQGESESHARQSERLGELERELRDGCARRREEIARAERDLERYASEHEQATHRAGELAAALDAARTARDEVGLRLDSQRTAIDAEQELLHTIEKARREVQGRRHAAEMALSECTLRRQNLLERIAEHYGLDEAALLGLAFEWTDEDPVPEDAAVHDLRDEMGRLGPVNLLALEEHEEKEARLRFLETQREDLVKASASLTETIDKINRTAHFLFMETFDQIRGHFQETIRTVFDGGEGDLRLANPDDPMESDIEILVRPRGKRIDTLTQLSSGERALTAIALLFSIYLVKPSPFCVFDEVDAPLDDANIGRFVNLLQEFKNRTQFIVITHNKLTMEAADRLYGVTMEEEGVSKLVSVALDGELRGVPRDLRKKTDKVRRAAALLQPTVESLAGAAGGPEAAAAGNGGGDGDGDHAPARRERAAARLERAPRRGADTGTALLDPEAEAAGSPPERPPAVE